MIEISTLILKRFFEQADKKMEGEWILLGGTLLPALGIHYRSTVDIDFVKKTPLAQGEQLLLMEISESLGLPVEAINPAAAYFLYKIKDFEKSLLLLFSGTSIKIYRPNLWLFVSLKLSRLSETDLSDCLKYIEYSVSHGDTKQIELLETRIGAEIDRERNPNKKKRMKDLLKVIRSVKA
jgi:hypothetical protein